MLRFSKALKVVEGVVAVDGFECVEFLVVGLMR